MVMPGTPQGLEMARQAIERGNAQAEEGSLLHWKQRAITAEQEVKTMGGMIAHKDREIAGLREAMQAMQLKMREDK